MHQPLDPPQKHTVTKYTHLPHQVRPTWAKPILSERPNIIEDDYGNSPTYLQRNVHTSPSYQDIILPDVPVLPPRVHPAQPPRVDTCRPISNLRSSCKKNPFPKFVLAEYFLQVREANAVTHKISGVTQEYRHLVKYTDRNIWERYFADELGQLAHGIRTVKGKIQLF